MIFVRVLMNFITHHFQSCHRHRSSIRFAAARVLILCVLPLLGAPSIMLGQSKPVQVAAVDLVLPAPSDSSAAAVKSMPEAFLGSYSCGSTSCHGSPRRESTIDSASHFYFDRDPHQNGGIVLRQPRSIEMAKRLKLPSPWEARECLACHAPAANPTSNPSHFSSMIVEGVGCESCHGAAKNWLTAHHTYEWKRPEIWSSSRKAQAGFRETKSLHARIDACADCHVGNENQFVSHDFIAAGHPRLAFEFSAYQSKMPVHWRRADDRFRTPVANKLPSSERSTYEAANWLMGQFVNADHELSILSRVAGQSDRAWPELAQYDCFACHHELNSPSWRHERKSSELKPGSLAWGTWNLGFVSVIQPNLSVELSKRFTTNQRALRIAMSNLAVDGPSIQPLICELKHDLKHAMQVLAASNLTAEKLGELKATLLTEEEKLTRQGWDQSAQLYLALVALDKGIADANGLGNRVDPAKELTLIEIRKLLAYEPQCQTRHTAEHRESPFRLNGNWSKLHEKFEGLRSIDVKSNAGEQSDGSEGVLRKLMPEEK